MWTEVGFYQFISQKFTVKHFLWFLSIDLVRQVVSIARNVENEVPFSSDAKVINLKPKDKQVLVSVSLFFFLLANTLIDRQHTYG